MPRGYRSLRCVPCTRVSAKADERAGRHDPAFLAFSFAPRGEALKARKGHGVTVLPEEMQSLAHLGRRPRITLVRSGALGDTILLLPAVELLRRAAPDVKLTLMGSAWARHVARLMSSPWTAASFGAAELAPLFVPGAEMPLPAALAEADLVVVYTSERETPFVSNVRRLRCGAGTLTWPDRPPAGVHAAAHLAGALTQELPALEELPVPHLRPPPVSGHRRHAALAELVRRPPESSLVVVHPGSGGGHKCWPAGRCAEFVAAIAGGDATVVMLRGPADEAQCEAVLERLAGSARPPVAELESLEDVAALMSLADVYVGNDSGPSHLAAALGVPTLAVFGPTDPASWRPLGANVGVVRGPAGEAGDRWPSVAEVLGAARRLLARY